MAIPTEAAHEPLIAENPLFDKACSEIDNVREWLDSDMADSIPMQLEAELSFLMLTYGEALISEGRQKEGVVDMVVDTLYRTWVPKEEWSPDALSTHIESAMYDTLHLYVVPREFIQSFDRILVTKGGNGVTSEANQELLDNYQELLSVDATTVTSGDIRQMYGGLIRGAVELAHEDPLALRETVSQLIAIIKD